ncbi:MAG: TetR/AcrR family transcriptional regulator [Granulosicoccaceae bacterium]
MHAQPRRELLIETAHRLFNQHGYHATGIDRILSESGVSKATLYKHFRSKDALVIAVLERRQKQVYEGARQVIAKASAQDQPVLALFDFLFQWFQSDDFFGCNFIKASSEFLHTEHPVHRLAAQHKLDMRALIRESLRTENKDLRDQQAMMLALLSDGAIVNAQMHNDPQAALAAKQAALCLLQSA